MKHIYVATSKIAGMGVMAGESIKKGELIRYIKGQMKFKVNESKEDALDNPDWVGIAKNQWIDPDKPYKFLNHSCNPTAGVKGRVALVALRDMKEGDEINIDYSTIEADERWEMRCSCGEPLCRKKILSIQHLPETTFEKYLPNIPKYFQQLYHKAKSS